MIQLSERLTIILILYGFFSYSYTQPTPVEHNFQKDFPGNLSSEMMAPNHVSSNLLITIENENHLGVVNGDGNIIIPFHYDNLGPWGEGMIAVNQGAEGVGWGRKGGKWGFADENGELRVPVKFDEVHLFYQGLVAVRLGEAWCLVDKNGEVVRGRKYQAIQRPGEGKRAALFGDQWGFLDDSGDWLIEPRFEDAKPFSGGRARVAVSVKEDDESEKVLYGLIDPQGKWIAEPQYDYINVDVNGFSTFEEHDEFGNTKFGYLDQDGNQIVPAQFGYGGIFNDGRAVVTDFKEAKKGFEVKKISGLIDERGKRIKVKNYEYISDFKEGFAVVSWKYSAWGDELEVNEEGFISNWESQPSFGLIGKDGKEVLELDYGYLHYIGNSKYIVRKRDRIEKGVIKSDGGVVIPFEHDELIYLGDESGAFVSGYRNHIPGISILDSEGKVLFHTDDYAMDTWVLGSDVVLVRSASDQKCGLIDLKGNIILPAKYDSIWEVHIKE